MLLLGLLLSICLLFTFVMYRRYASKNISSFASFCIILVWFITFSNAVIVPYDIYLSFDKLHMIDGNDLEDDSREHASISNLIKVFYVIMQFMSIIVIPMLLEYEMAGEFTFKEKLCTAIKRNLIFYGVAVTLILSFIAYLIVQKQLTGANLLNFLIALTNAWGIFLIIFLNGFGLVELPKKVFRNINNEKRIKRLEYQAAQLSDEKDDFEDALKECAGKLKALKEKCLVNDNGSISNKVEIMWEILSQTDDKYLAFTPSKEHIEYANTVKEDKLSILNRNLKKACHEYTRANK